MYYQAPYVLLIAGLFTAITSGFAFSNTLQQSVRNWNTNRSSRILASLRGLQLQIPFLGICTGVCVFLAAGIQSFGFSAKVAFAMGVPLTLLSALLVWSQLGKLLLMLEKGGSRALDLDAF